MYNHSQNFQPTVRVGFWLKIEHLLTLLEKYLSLKQQVTMLKA